MAKKTDELLAGVIADNLNKLFKDKDQIAYIGDEDSPTDLDTFVSTGSSLLDLAISNRPFGGLPFGRIVELTGLEQSGKSLVAAHLMANTQKMGGVAVLIDTETAVNWEFFEAVGVDRSKNWVYAQIETVEDIFDAVVNIIETVRKSNKDRPVTIVIDSIAGASTKQEMAADFDRQGYATGKAILLSTAMRKVTSLIGRQKVLLAITNQLRQKLGAMPFSDPWTTSGGKAIAFHSSVRLRLAQVAKIKRKGEDNAIIGVTVQATVIKNRLGPPLRKAEFDIYFDRGIDDTSSWLKYLKDHEIIEGTSSLSYTDAEGTEHKIPSTEFRDWLDKHPELRDEIYLKMCDKMIMQYKSDGLTAEDIQIDDSSDEE
jgi:recombination protein RecA